MDERGLGTVRNLLMNLIMLIDCTFFVGEGGGEKG